MSPLLNDGRIVMASSLVKPSINSVVIVNHDGLEKVKRLNKISQKGIFILGDNENKSTDSEDFGWLEPSSIVATVIWPIYQQKR